MSHVLMKYRDLLHMFSFPNGNEKEKKNRFGAQFEGSQVIKKEELFEVLCLNVVIILFFFFYKRMSLLSRNEQNKS